MQAKESGQINTEAFMTLTNIAFASVERLAALNLKATRAAFENSVAMTSSALQAKSESEKQKLLASTPSEATNSALAYLQGVQKIAADTQNQIATLMNSYLAQHGEGTPTAAWSKGFEMFKGFGQQITNMTEANTRTAVEAADQVTRSVVETAKKRSA